MEFSEMDPNNTEALDNLIELGRCEMYQKHNYKEAKRIFISAKTNAPSYQPDYINVLLNICIEREISENEKHHDSKNAITEQKADNTGDPFVGDSVRGGREAIKDVSSEFRNFPKNIPLLENTEKAGTMDHNTKDNETLMDYAQAQHQGNFMHSQEKNKAEEKICTEYENRAQEEKEAEMMHNSLKMRSYVLQIGITAFSLKPNYRTDVDFENISLEVNDLILKARSAFLFKNKSYEYFISEAEKKYSEVAIILPRASISKQIPIKPKDTNTIKKNNIHKIVGNNAMSPLENKKSVSYKEFVKGDNIDVVKCLKLAETALIAEDFNKAERLIKKSERICPTKNAQELFKKLEVARKEAIEREVAKQAAELAAQHAAELAAKEAFELAAKKAEELAAKKAEELAAIKAKELADREAENLAAKKEKEKVVNKTTVEQVVNKAQKALDMNDLIKAKLYLLEAKYLDSKIDIDGLQERLRIAIASRSSTNTDTDPLLVIEDEVQLTDNKKQNSKQYLNLARQYLDRGDISQAEINLLIASEHYNSMAVLDMLKSIEKLKESESEKDSYKIPKPSYVDSCSENNFALRPGKEETPSYHLANNNFEKDQTEEYLKTSRLALTNKNYEKAEEYAYRCLKNAPVRAKSLLSDIKENKEKTRETMTLRSGRTLNTNIDHKTRYVLQKDLITDDEISLDKNYENLNKAESLQIQSERLRAQPERITVQGELGESCKLSDRGWRSGTNIESNKEAYNKCIEKAEEALFVKDYETADRLVKRAYRMNPGVELESFIEKIQIEKQMNEEVKCSCQNPDTHNERPLYADDNQMEAKKCEKFAEEAYAQGNIDKAERLFVKASRMGSSKTIKDSLAKVQKEKNMNADDKSKNADDNFDTSAEGTLEASENEITAEKLKKLAQDAMNLNCYYVAESYLKKANHVHPNKTTKQLLEDARAAIQASLANTHSEKQDKIEAVEKKKQMQTEAYKFLKMAQDKIAQNDLDNAQSFAILSDSLCKSDDSRNLLKRIFDLKYKAEMHINKKIKRDQYYNKFKSEQYIEIAENAFIHGEFRLAEEYLIQSKNMYYNPKAQNMLVKVRDAIKREAAGSSHQEGWVNWLKKKFL